jgi:isopentenyl-diphosphate delta-isomerase
MGRNDSSENRKKEHLTLCTTDKVAFKKKSTLFEQVNLIHRALPELQLADVDLSVEFCGKRSAAPLWMSAITGGTTGAIPFNKSMAALAEELNIPFCLGSLQPMLLDPSSIADFQVRQVAPSILIMGNIGGTELAARGHEPIVEALKRIGADGLGIHLNPAMELIQPGGDTDFRGVTRAIGKLIESVPDLPVVVKETGCGLSLMDGIALKQVGVKMVEVAGAGGTSWVGVETLRADKQQARLGEMLWDWGVPTAVSTTWLASQGFEVVAAGGIRTAMDMACALALGARFTGIAAPLVRAYHENDGGEDATRKYLEDLLEGLKAILLICGVDRPEKMSKVPRVIGPDLDRWIRAGTP